MSTNITIGATTITQDVHGRFCLNDLHRAAGGAPRHQPGLFLRLDKTEEMVALLRSTDLQIEPLVVLRGGVTQGTFVVKDLVYDYAMWISPAFRLTVIRAFDAMATGHVPPPPPQALPRDYEEALAELLAKVRENKRLAAENAANEAALAVAAPKVEAYERFLSSDGTLSLRDTVKSLGLKEKALIAQLVSDNILYRTQGTGQLRAYAHLEERGYFRHRAGSGDSSGKAFTWVRITPMGLAWLAEKYVAKQEALQLGAGEGVA